MTGLSMDIRILYQVLGADCSILAFIPAVNMNLSGLSKTGA